MTWPQYRDATEDLAQSFHVSAVPMYILIDGDGAEVRRVSGLRKQQSVGYRPRRQLEAILGKPE
jgi:hypothetical protein